MKKLHLSIHIKASRKTVWDTIIGEHTYRQWSEVFMPGSHAKGSWEKGSSIQFLAPGEDGKTMDGMASEIAENKPGEFLSIKHIGFVQQGVVDTTSPAVKAWAPSYENYTLTESNGGTDFTLDMDADDSYYDYFSRIWPKAMEKIKEIAETGKNSTIAIAAWIKAPVEKIWDYYTTPVHIPHWNFASDDWESPHAEIDLREGGTFVIAMAAKDKSAAFDFAGTYTKVKKHESLDSTLEDGRNVWITFMPGKQATLMTVVFDMEHTNSREMQQQGWLAILNNFKKYVESN